MGMLPRVMPSSLSKMWGPSSRSPECMYSLVIYCRIPVMCFADACTSHQQDQQPVGADRLPQDPLVQVLRVTSCRVPSNRDCGRLQGPPPSESMRSCWAGLAADVLTRFRPLAEAGQGCRESCHYGIASL